MSDCLRHPLGWCWPLPPGFQSKSCGSTYKITGYKNVQMALWICLSNPRKDLDSPKFTSSFGGNPNARTIFFICKVKKKLKYQCGESALHETRAQLPLTHQAKASSGPLHLLVFLPGTVSRSCISLAVYFNHAFLPLGKCAGITSGKISARRSLLERGTSCGGLIHLCGAVEPRMRSA